MCNIYVPKLAHGALASPSIHCHLHVKSPPKKSQTGTHNKCAFFRKSRKAFFFSLPSLSRNYVVFSTPSVAELPLKTPLVSCQKINFSKPVVVDTRARLDLARSSLPQNPPNPEKLSTPRSVHNLKIYPTAQPVDPSSACFFRRFLFFEFISPRAHLDAHLQSQ